ncbi:MAG: hypothetical protein HQM13_17885 [SAR324 cluster bacterium]|nr:hypothetical protein [SAR324 cluster bacterium]
MKAWTVRYEMKDENSFNPDAFLKALKKAKYKNYKNYSKLKKTRIYAASGGEGSPSSYHFLKAFMAHMGDRIKSQKIKLFWVRDGGAPAMIREFARNPKPYMKKEYVKE